MERDPFGGTGESLLQLCAKSHLLSKKTPDLGEMDKCMAGGHSILQ